jgi:hypothetical protein
MAYLRYCTGVGIAELRERRKACQGSWYLYRDLNLGLTECEVGLLPSPPEVE